MTTAASGDVKIWRRRDRNSQLAIWAAWLIATAIFAIIATVYVYRLVSLDDLMALMGMPMLSPR